MSHLFKYSAKIMPACDENVLPHLKIEGLIYVEHVVLEKPEDMKNLRTRIINYIKQKYIVLHPVYETFDYLMEETVKFEPIDTI